jgi:hypothetical protein
MVVREGKTNFGVDFKSTGRLNVSSQEKTYCKEHDVWGFEWVVVRQTDTTVVETLVIISLGRTTDCKVPLKRLVIEWSCIYVNLLLLL